MEEDFLLRWLEKVALEFHADSKLDTRRRSGRCYYEFVYKFMKVIHTTPSNFLKEALTAENPLAVTAFDYLYFPKMELEKTEYSTQNDTRSEILDADGDNFVDDDELEAEAEHEDILVESAADDNSEEVYEETDPRLYASHTNGPEVLPFDEGTSSNEFSDVNFWKARSYHGSDSTADMHL